MLGTLNTNLNGNCTNYSFHGNLIDQLVRPGDLFGCHWMLSNRWPKDAAEGEEERERKERDVALPLVQLPNSQVAC